MILPMGRFAAKMVLPHRASSRFAWSPTLQICNKKLDALSAPSLKRADDITYVLGRRARLISDPGSAARYRIPGT